MAKKSNQWGLDRAFTLNEENEERLRGLLSCIKQVKEEKYSKEEAITQAVEKGWLTKRGKEGYEQSTATLLRSIGLVTQNEYETTEVADAFVDNEISYKEMLLMQLAKKEFKYSEDAEIVHPLLVTLKTLLLLKQEADDQAWIDAYDYLYFLTELKRMSDIDKMVKNIIKKRSDKKREIGYDKIYDFDMWISAFIFTGLLKEIPHEKDIKSENIKYKLNENELGIIEWLANDSVINNIANIDEFIRNSKRKEVLVEFGKLNNGIVSLIPQIHIGKEYDVNNIKTNEKELLKLFLFGDGKFRSIEKQLFGDDDNLLRGLFSKYLINSYGLSHDNAASIWKDFINYPGLVKLASCNIKDSKVYKALFLNEDEVNRNNIYKKAANYAQSYVEKEKIDVFKIESDLEELIKAFLEKFSPQKLLEIEDTDLLVKLFYTAEQTNDSFNYWLEHKIDKGFGGSKGTFSNNYGVYQNTDDKKWKDKGNNIITKQEALNIGKKIRDALCEGARIIEKTECKSLSDYEYIDSALEKIFNGLVGHDNVWIQKYYSILFPNKICAYYNDEWQEHVLRCFLIKPSEKRYIRSGQISMISNHCGWNNLNLAEMIYSRFGPLYVKFCRLGVKPGNHYCFDKWIKDNYVGIGWSESGDLSKIKKNFDNTIIERVAKYHPKSPSQISRFYNANKKNSRDKLEYYTIFALADNDSLLAIADNIDEYRFEKDAIDCHRKQAKIHLCFNHEKLPYKNEGFQHTCTDINNVQNIEFLYKRYYYEMNEIENRNGFISWAEKVKKIDEVIINDDVRNINSIIISNDLFDQSLFATSKHRIINEEIRKQILHGPRGKQVIDSLKRYKEYLKEREVKKMIELKFEKILDIKKEKNRIVFGAPGTGKSFQIKKDSEELVEQNGAEYERVTFHPDYTYAQFVGAYKPYMDGDEIQYQFVPGPFMRVLTKALKNINSEKETKPFILIVEEINRANVAAVFGDVFQLLDRKENGTSEYEIEASEEVKDYLSLEFDANPESFNKIRIPNNMFIWATMNSADQGVFPMDTAFKRRWNFEYLNIDNNEDKIAKFEVDINESQKKINWNDLRKSINDKLISLEINEDKLMGPFFINEDVLKNKDNNYQEFNETFKNKVLMYLFEDAAKQKRPLLFNEDIAKTNQLLFSSICDYYDDNGLKVFSKDISEKFLKEE